MASDTYVELLPKTWFEYNGEDMRMHPQLLLFGITEAYEKLLNYDQPKDPRVAHYISLSPSEKIEFLQSFNLTEINKLMIGDFTKPVDSTKQSQKRIHISIIFVNVFPI